MAKAIPKTGGKKKVPISDKKAKKDVSKKKQYLETFREFVREEKAHHKQPKVQKKPVKPVSIRPTLVAWKDRALGQLRAYRSKMQNGLEKISIRNKSGVMFNFMDIDDEGRNIIGFTEKQSQRKLSLIAKSITDKLGLVRDRYVVYFKFYCEYYDRDDETEELNVVDRNMRISDILDIVYLRYDHIIKVAYIQNAYIYQVPLQGSCDSERVHKINLMLDNGNKTRLLTYSSVKSKNNNCLISAFASCVKKPIRNNAQYSKIRKQIGVEDGVPIGQEKCEQLAQIFECSYALFTINEQMLKLEHQSEEIKDSHCILCLQNGHYYTLDKMPPSDFVIKAQVQVQDQDVPICSENVINYAQKLSDIDYTIACFKKELVDPELEEIFKAISSGNHILIQGPGGVGKSWTIQRIVERFQSVKITASTGQAGRLIGGQTTHSIFKHTGQINKAISKEISERIIVIDECSMIGSTYFDRILAINKMWKKQLIIVGDVLQLPPVCDNYIFESCGFQKFAKNCVNIKLTKVRRQENVEQIEFLNKLRLGTLDKEFLNRLVQQKCEKKPNEIYLCSKNKIADKINEDAMNENCKGERRTYASIVKNKDKELLDRDKKQYPDVEFAIGARVMLLVNLDIEKGFVNGSCGIVEKIEWSRVLVNFDDIGLKHIEYVEQQSENYSNIKFMPLRVAYAISIHKAQGLTLQCAKVDLSDLFEYGQAYVALSRVQDLKNLSICGRIDTNQKGWQPNPTALKFVEENKICSADQKLFIQEDKKQFKNVRIQRHEDFDSISNHIYFDFETRNDEAFQQVPYYNKILHICQGKTIHVDRMFDQLWEGGERCNVGQKTWEYIKKVIIDYGDQMKKYRMRKDKKAINGMKKLIPHLIAYNGAGFDFNFILRKYIADEYCSKRFRVNLIYKSSYLIFLSIFDTESGFIVLRTHDIFQILNCSLSSAITNYCDVSGELKQKASKIEFKSEIIYILNNYTRNPEILKPGVITKIGNREIDLHDEVIKYADNDVDVLPILYRSVDELCKQLDVNVSKFSTAGNLAWYGALSNLPKEALEIKYDKNRNKIDSKSLNTKIYGCEMYEDKFCSDAIYGGRVCPRAFRVKGQKYNILDISGMYAWILQSQQFPFDKKSFLDHGDMQIILKTAQRETKCGDWRKIFNRITEKFGLFIARCTYDENPHNLEPVLPRRVEGKTMYSVEANCTQVITSVDIALLIESGGKIRNISEVMVFASRGQIFKQWIDKNLEWKQRGERENKSGLKSLGKMCSNASFGQSLKSDKNQVMEFVSNWEQANQFVSNNQLEDIFEVDEYSIMTGQRLVDKTAYISSRAKYIGAFVLAYARAMVFEIVEIACPNRYNENGVFEQPVYGDTDSLYFLPECTERLIKAGWVKKENGKLCDELGEKSHWFMPERFRQVVSGDKKKTPVEQEYIWATATEEEKRDPKNFYMYYFDDGLFPGPKSYGLKYSNNKGEYVDEKIKFKGIPQTSKIMKQMKDEKVIDITKLKYDVIVDAYEQKNTMKVTAMLPSKPQLIKRFTAKEGSQKFLQIVDSNHRRIDEKTGEYLAVTRQFFKTNWKGRLRYEFDENFTVPHGWIAQE